MTKTNGTTTTTTTNGHSNGHLNGHANGTNGTNGAAGRKAHDVDPLTTESAYPLSVNDLEDLCAFEHTEAGLSLVSKVSLPAGAHFVYLTSHAPQPSPTWKTIQTSPSTHTDPRSSLLYMNHSCRPSVEVHTYSPNAEGAYPSVPPQGTAADLNGQKVLPVGLAGEVRIARDRGIEPGEALTFFYPSTEWQFDRPFQCLCGAGDGVCVGNVQGAAFIETQDMPRWHFNEHIHLLAKQRDANRKLPN